MLFADILFLFVFLPLCLISYFVCKDIKAKNAVLLVFSLIFYAWGEPVRILLLVLSAAINYAFAIMIELSKGTRKAKSYLVMSLIYNIGMLAIFKYTDFFLQNVNALLGTSIPMQNIALPLGISFYTFQIISYVIDVYWDKVSAQRKFSDLLMYISLFPQLVAGPIVRYETVAREIRSRKTTIADFSEGACRLIVGLTKKVLLANNLNLLVELMFGVHKTSAGTVINIGNSTVLGAWIGVIAYAMQVYFDFSGYSDMAIGMGRIFGFHFDENFNYPFICRSISEFWQRWHISFLCPDFRKTPQISLVIARVVYDGFVARCIVELCTLGSLFRLFHFHRIACREETPQAYPRCHNAYIQQNRHSSRIRYILLYGYVSDGNVFQSTCRCKRKRFQLRNDGCRF